MASFNLPLSLDALVGVGVLYLLYCIYWELTTGATQRRTIRQKGCQPPRKLKDWDPLFGAGRTLQTIRWIKEHKLLENGRRRFMDEGNTFFMNSLGRKLVLTIEPENLKTIQALDFKNWGLGTRRKKAFLPFLGPGIFTTDGTAWQHSRDMLRPNFVRSQVGDLETFEVHVNHLIQAIPRDGSMVDLQGLFFRLTIDSATEFLFGSSTNCLAPGVSTVSAANFAAAFNRCQEAAANSARFGRLGDLLPRRQYKRDTKTVHDFVDDFVDRAFVRRLHGKSSNRYVFADELVKQTNDRVQIRSELLNILLAGRDTTASLLSNVWFELSKRPDIFAKLKAEVDTALPDGTPPTFERLKEMKYLKAVLHESLRLYPVVPGNSREAVADTTLPLGGGEDGRSPLFVAKGTVVGWSVYTMHRRKDFYGPDAEEFRPERWLGEKGLRPGWEYLPFNGGPRICLGQQFALTEASYTTIRLLQEFGALESRDAEPWVEWLTLTCTGLNGCKVVLTPRQYLR